MGDATRPGGGALYAAITAHRLGLSVGLLTSHAADFPLDAIPSRIEVVTVDASATTRFEHRYAAGGRVSHVRSRAAPLSAADVPDDWLGAPLVLLAPVLDEVDPRLAPSSYKTRASWRLYGVFRYPRSRTPINRAALAAS